MERHESSFFRPRRARDHRRDAGDECEGGHRQDAPSGDPSELGRSARAGGRLGNAHNYAAYYRATGEPFEIEIITFGPGYSMVRADMSMMKGELENLRKDLGASLAIAACHNTRRALADNEARSRRTSPSWPVSMTRRAASSASPSRKNEVGRTFAPSRPRIIAWVERRPAIVLLFHYGNKTRTFSTQNH